MAAPTERLSFLDVRASTDWVQAAGGRLVRGVWGSPSVPAVRLLANARAAISRRADQLLDGLEAQGAHLVSGLAEQAGRLAERMAARLSVASQGELIEARQWLTQVERKLDRLAREGQDRPPDAPGVDPDEIPPPLPPWPAE